MSQASFCAAIKRSAVSAERWIFPGRPVFSIREQVFTTSPKSYKKYLSTVILDKQHCELLYIPGSGLDLLAVLQQ
jgi:hypothetical protein